MRAGFITVGAQGFSVALQTLSTIVLARLINPESYGTIGMVTTATAFASLFQDLGLSAATVQRDKITPQQSTVLFWLNVAAASLITLVLILCAPLIADFYKRPELVAVTCALAVNIALSSLGAQHAALLNREMKFRHLASARISAALAQFLVTLAAALANLQYWALVIGIVTSTVVNVALLWNFSGWRPGWPSRGTGVRGMMHYGLNLTAFDFVNYFSRNLDNVLVGRVWGAEELGFYAKAYSLLLFPISNIRAPIVAVAMPAMSRLQHDDEAFRGYYCRLVGLLGFVTMPIATLFVVCSDQIVYLMLGQKWMAAAEIARWLAVSSFLQPVAGLFGVVLMSKGLANRHMRCGLVSAIAMSLSFVVGVFQGPVVMAIYYAVVQYILFVPIFLYASRGTGIHLRDFFANVHRQAAGAVFAGVATHLLRSFAQLPLGLPGFLASLGCFTAVYATFSCLVPGGLRDLQYYSKLISSGLGRTAPPQDSHVAGRR